MFGRKSLLWLTAAITVLAVFVPGTASALSGPNACNGATELCDRPLNQVVLPGTHNSMSNEEYGWSIPNQHYAIPTQLKMGIRAFLIDTHYGKSDPGNPKRVTDASKAESDGVYLCHENCLLGASGLTAELGKVADFLAANPREVLAFMVENYVEPDDFAAAVTDSGLIDYVYTGPTDHYPTLKSMIDANQRVVMFSEGDTGSVAWFHNGYAGAVQETPYDFRRNEAGDVLTTRQGMDLLTNPATLDSTCRPNRGGTTGALFLMNHWVNGKLDNSNAVIPDPDVAKVLNQKDVLVTRARACETRRGKLPNIVAVDDFGDGDLLGAVNELNGIAPDPKPEPDSEPEPEPKGVRLTVKTPKSVRVKAGKAAIFKVTLTNRGDVAGKARVCAKVPRRLARKPRCLKRTVKAGQKVTLKLKVRTKAKAKGRGTVKITTAAAGKSVTKRSALVVKKKPRKRR